MSPPEILHDIYCSYDNSPTSPNLTQIQNIVQKIKEKNWRVCDIDNIEYISQTNILLCFVTRFYSLSPKCKNDVDVCHRTGKSIIYILMEPQELGLISINNKTLENEITINFNKNRDQIKEMYEQLFSLITYLIKQSNKYDGFISYRKSDSLKLVTEAYEKLQKRGLTLWFDKVHIRPGGDLHDDIFNGLQDSIVFVSFISKSYSGAKNCQLEYKTALNDQKPPVFIVLEKGVPYTDDLKCYMSNYVRLDVYKLGLCDSILDIYASVTTSNKIKIC